MPVRWRMSERWEACDDSQAPHSQLPSLSVIVPARNESDSLPLTLPSWLNQDYPESEIILIDVNQLTVRRNALIVFPHAPVVPSALPKERCLRLAGLANYGRFSRGSTFLPENGYYLPMPITLTNTKNKFLDNIFIVMFI